jgi:hypothetical protein
MGEKGLRPLSKYIPLSNKPKNALRKIVSLRGGHGESIVNQPKTKKNTLVVSIFSN